MNHDLSVDGPYSPVSLKKFLEQEEAKAATSGTPPLPGSLKVLIDGTGLGIAMDDPKTLVMTPEDRLEQARYYREQVFNGKQLPAFLFRYMRYMFISADEKEYPTDQSVLDGCNAGILTADHEDYKQVLNLVKYSHYNAEAAQVIGFIMLFAGTLHQAKKEQHPIRLLIQLPETSLHPKRTARWMSLFYKLQKEYGLQPLDDSL